MRIIMSKAHNVAETGVPKYLFMISGGISMPPVDAPVLITSPRLAPIIIPPKMVHRNRSSVLGIYTAHCSAICKKTGKTMVDRSVFAAKDLPSIFQPIKNKIVFKIPTTTAGEKPNTFPANRPRPVEPPIMSPAGSINIAIAKE